MTPTDGRTAVAAVFGTEWRNGLALLRELGRAGIEVLALSDKESSLGFRSRYAAERHLHPDPMDEPDEFLAWLRGFGEEQSAQGRVIVPFPTSDLLVSIFARHMESLPGFRCPFPSWSVVAGCLDKESQVRAALEVGVPAPKTYFSESLGDLHRDLDDGAVQFPLLLKQRESYTREAFDDAGLRRFRAVPLPDRGRLEEVIRTVESASVPFLIQEVIPGSDDALYTLGSYMNREGVILSGFTGRKLRQKPPKFGIARVAESVDAPSLFDLGAALLQRLGFFGISQVEFKLDSRDDTFKLIEVNPRSWSWIGLGPRTGARIAVAAFRDTVGLPVSPQKGSGRYRWICLADDLVASIQHRDAVPFLSLLHPTKGISEAYLSVTDPRPGIAHVWGEISGVIGNRLKRRGHRPPP